MILPYTHRTLRPALLTLPLALAVLTTACASTQPINTAAHPTPITIDGVFTDWPRQSEVEAVADDRHLFIRFAPGDGSHAIQAAPFTTRILIDADDNPDTGMAQHALGIDTAVLLSPPNATGTGIGAQVMAYDAGGLGTSTGHAELGFLFQPTHTSPAYEARIDRAALPASPNASVRVRVEQVEPGGAVLWSAAARADLPPISATRRDEESLPAKPRGATRVLSLNVLYSAPLTSPDAFRRTIRALDPDIILFQEWFNTAQPAIQQWATTHLGPGWTVYAPSTNGIAIAARHQILETVPTPLPESGPGAEARFAAAVIDAPGGPIIAGSLHLKCCGGAGGPEDTRRIAEAASINATVAAVRARHPGAAVAIGGDYNLVGTRTPLETLAAGLGTNGSDLVPAEALTLGDAAAVTWVDDKSLFSPGRLDWILIDPDSTTIRRAFTLDTRRISEASRRRAGLERDDSAATDHLPLVVDLTR